MIDDRILLLVRLQYVITLHTTTYFEQFPPDTISPSLRWVKVWFVSELHCLARRLPPTFYNSVIYALIVELEFFEAILCRPLGNCLPLTINVPTLIIISLYSIQTDTPYNDYMYKL